MNDEENTTPGEETPMGDMPVTENAPETTEAPAEASACKACTGEEGAEHTCGA